MKTVAEILDRKGSGVWTIAPTDTVRDALEIMAEEDVGALVVTKDKQIVGVISERDYARKVIIKGKSSLETSVAEIMAPDPRCVGPDTSIDECMAVMTDKRVRHLPVLDGTQLVGLVSIGDVVKSLIAEQQSKLRELESYIYNP